MNPENTLENYLGYSKKEKLEAKLGLLYSKYEKYNPTKESLLSLSPMASILSKEPVPVRWRRNKNRIPNYKVPKHIFLSGVYQERYLLYNINKKKHMERKNIVINTDMLFEWYYGNISDKKKLSFNNTNKVVYPFSDTTPKGQPLKKNNTVNSVSKSILKLEKYVF